MTGSTPRYLFQIALAKVIRIASAGILLSIFTARAVAAPGDLDPTFGIGGIASMRPATSPLNPSSTTVNSSSSVLDSAGRLLTAWPCAAAIGTSLCVTRYDNTGRLDASFGDGGLAVFGMRLLDGYPLRALLQLDGKIVVSSACVAAAQSPDVCAARILPTGIPDPTFGTGGQLSINLDGAANDFYDAVPQSGGRTLILTRCQQQPCLVMLSSSGTIDTTYGIQGIAQISRMANWFAVAAFAATTGDVYVVGGCASANFREFCIVRMNSSGQEDATFGLDAPAATEAKTWGSFGGIVMRVDGKLVVSGYSNSSTIRVMQLSDTGAIDVSFGQDGVATASLLWPFKFATLSIDQQGNVLAGYTCFSQGGAVSSWTWEFCAVRFTPSGFVDLAFGASGNLRVLASQTGKVSAFGTAITATDGKILVSGTCGEGTPSKVCIVRVKGGPYSAQSCTLNIDGNITLRSATDALLITRYLLGYRGDALTTGAVGASPTRTNAEIETHLSTLVQAGKLDVDGDAQSLAMTDGLLLIRAMLGLSGTALTNGATNSAHPNVRNAQQILMWIESTHGVACLP